MGAAWLLRRAVASGCGQVAACARRHTACDGRSTAAMSPIMSLYRYSHWDGSQSLPPFDADDILEALSDDILAEGDIRRALQRLMQRGCAARAAATSRGCGASSSSCARAGRRSSPGPPRRHARRRGRAARADRGAGAGGDRAAPARRRAAGARRGSGPAQDQARMAEQVLARTAQQRRDRLDALPADLAGRLAGLRDYEFMDADARDAFNALTDEIRQQLLQTYFQGMKDGRRRHLAGGPGRRAGDGPRPQQAPREARGRVRHERRLRELHGPPRPLLSARDRDGRPADRPPASAGVADGIADGVAQPRDAGRAAADDGRAAARRPPALGHGAPGRRPAGAPTRHARSASRIRSAATSRWACPRRSPPSTASSASTRWRRSCSAPATPTRWTRSMPRRSRRSAATRRPATSSSSAR